MQYLRARRIPETRSLATRYAVGFGLAAVLWIISALLPAPERYWMWGVAFVVDFSTPRWTFKHSTRFPPDAAHFPERFGLFTIILLGEFVAAVMRGIESQEYWSVAAASTAFASMAFAFAVMWWYFDGARSSAERHVRNRREAILFHIWNYAHLPLFLSIGVAGVGFERLISDQGREMLDSSGASILCSAVALLMLALTTLGIPLDGESGKQTALKYLMAALPGRSPGSCTVILRVPSSAGYDSDIFLTAMSCAGRARTEEDGLLKVNGRLSRYLIAADTVMPSFFILLRNVLG